MKKSAFLLLFLLLAAPAFAQTGQQFGILLGGTKRLYSGHDRSAGDPNNNAAGITENLPIDRFRLTHGAKEVFFAVQVEPATWFKVQAGQWNTDVGIVESGKDRQTGAATGPTKFPRSGTVQHADGIVDYKFSEPYGTTGLFVGLGVYRWSASGPAPDAVHDVPTETNYGYTFGVDGDFPITRRYGFIVEGAYHWINMSSPVRYVTVTGGIRVAF